MDVVTRRRRRGGTDLARHMIGNATVVYRVGRLSDQARTLALTVAEDRENALVVVDLPAESPVSVWESVAEVLPRRRGGVRLVIGGRSRETTALAGQLLSERLGRNVIAPDGTVIRGAGGSLIVHSGRGSGWVRFRRGRAPRWEAKRFPKPPWDADVPTDIVPTSEHAVVEPIPGGAWLRPIGHDARQRWHRVRLTECVPLQPDVLTVVLGCPGGPPLRLDDTAAMFQRIPPATRAKVRFVVYGPVQEPIGPALANLAGTEVVCHTGLPWGSSGPADVHTVRPDGSLGWRPFATELAYQSRQARPVVRAYRKPLDGLAELAPRVFWYAADAVVEVTRSGLLVRSPAENDSTEAVRALTGDPVANLLVFDPTDETTLGRMRFLAEDLLRKLDQPTRSATRLLPATAFFAESEPTEPTASPAESALTETGLTEIGLTETGLTETALAEATPTKRSSSREGDPLISSLVDLEAGNQRVAGDLWTESTSDEPEQAPAAPEELKRAPAPEALEQGSAADEPEQVPTAGQPEQAPAAGTPEQVPDVEPTEHIEPIEHVEPTEHVELAVPATESVIAARLAPVPPPVAMGGVSVSEPPVAPQPPPVTQPTAVPPTERPTEGQPTAVRVAPTPAPEAAALLPDHGLDQERTWLRDSLGAQFGTMSNAVARVLSQNPGFQGALSRSSLGVLTDAVAVQLYLSPQGSAIDDGLRAAVVGPHVPIARCVVSGLSRLPSHRGPSVFAATVTEEQREFYRDRRLVTEWGFVNALTGPCVDQMGDTDIVIWSMTARRTKLLEPARAEVVDRVLFVPGTSFKVLDSTEKDDSGRGRILLRELGAAEIDGSGRVDDSRTSLDELALTTLRRQCEQWAAATPHRRVGAASAARFGTLPGLA